MGSDLVVHRVRGCMLPWILCAPCAAALACEPAAFDFPRFLADHDTNRDGFLQQGELVDVAYDPDRYLGRLDKPVNTAQAFVELDADKDRRLSLQELWAWGQYTRNACAGMDSSARVPLSGKPVAHRHQAG